MKIILELPDEAHWDVDQLLEWIRNDRFHLSSQGAWVQISAPPGPGGHVFAWRLLGIGLAGEGQ